MSSSFSYEEYLEQNGSLTYRCVGVSMLPLLRQGKDLLTVKKKGAERCAKGDVVLYRRPPDLYVLHRIIEVRPSDYVILGDNCVAREYGIRDEDIIGILTSFVRNGKEHKVTEPGYRIYSFLWLHFWPIRVFLKKMTSRLKRLAIRILRHN